MLILGTLQTKILNVLTLLFQKETWYLRELVILQRIYNVFIRIKKDMVRGKRRRKLKNKIKHDADLEYLH